MLSSSQNVGFINQPYPKNHWVSQHNVLRAYIDWNKEKGDLTICSWAGLKMLLTDQITEYSKQVHLKKHKVHQPYILYLDRVQGRLIVKKKIGKVG